MAWVPNTRRQIAEPDYGKMHRGLIKLVDETGQVVWVKTKDVVMRAPGDNPGYKGGCEDGQCDGDGSEGGNDDDGGDGGDEGDDGDEGEGDGNDGGENDGGDGKDGGDDGENDGSGEGGEGNDDDHEGEGSDDGNDDSDEDARAGSKWVRFMGAP